jgi:hypothetical protein
MTANDRHWRFPWRQLLGAFVCVLGVGCTGAPPPAPPPTIVPAGPVGDDAVLLALDSYEPVYKVDANGRVTDLRLGGRHLPVSALAEIAKLKELRGLALFGTDISDDGLAYLKGLSKLRALELRGTPVTDRGLVHLENLASLQYVWLPKKTVTQEAADMLKNSLPEIKGVYRP